jgi:hypothetical protein
MPAPSPFAPASTTGMSPIGAPAYAPQQMNEFVSALADRCQTQDEFIQKFQNILPQLSPTFDLAGVGAFLLNMPWLQKAGEELVDSGLPGVTEKIPAGLAKAAEAYAKVLKLPGGKIVPILKKIRYLDQDFWLLSTFTKATVGNVAAVKEEQAAYLVSNMLSALLSLPAQLIDVTTKHFPKLSQKLVDLTGRHLPGFAKILPGQGAGEAAKGSAGAVFGQIAESINGAIYVSGFVQQLGRRVGNNYYVHDNSDLKALFHKIVHGKPLPQGVTTGQLAKHELGSQLQDAWTTQLLALKVFSDAFKSPEAFKSMMNPRDKKGAPARASFAVGAIYGSIPLLAINKFALAKESKLIGEYIKGQGLKMLKKEARVATERYAESLGKRGKYSLALTKAGLGIATVGAGVLDMGIVQMASDDIKEGKPMGFLGIAGVLLRLVSEPVLLAGLGSKLAIAGLRSGFAGQNFYLYSIAGDKKAGGKRIVLNKDRLLTPPAPHPTAASTPTPTPTQAQPPTGLAPDCTSPFQIFTQRTPPASG